MWMWLLNFHSFRWPPWANIIQENFPRPAGCKPAVCSLHNWLHSFGMVQVYLLLPSNRSSCWLGCTRVDSSRWHLCHCDPKGAAGSSKPGGGYDYHEWNGSYDYQEWDGAITDNVIHMSSCSAVCIRYNCSLTRVWHNTSPLPAVLRGQTWYILSHHLKTQITPLELRSKCEVICEPVNWAISWYSINSGNADSESRRVASWQPLHQILDLPISGSEFVNGAY